MGYEKNLKGDYLKSYNEVMDELKVEDISIELTKEIENDVLDMFLCAQHDGASPTTIVGESPRIFILEILRNFNKTKSWIFRGGQVLSRICLGIGALSFLNIRNGKLDFTVDILVCLALILSSDLVGRLLSRKYNIGKTRSSSRNNIKYIFFLIGVVISIAITTRLDLPVLFIINKPYLFVGGCLCAGLLTNIGIEMKVK
ncbi:MAG: hypothetical protein ACRCTZ_18775 [Sarcina sp.]